MSGPEHRRLSWLVPAAVPAAALVLLLIGLPAPTQQPLPRDFLEGTHVFRRIMQDMHFQPVKDWRSLSHPDQIIIFHGDPGQRMPWNSGLKTFLEKGGAVLFASDQEITDPELRQVLRSVAGVTVAEQRVYYPTDRDLPPERSYRNQFCPILLPLKAEPDLFPGTRPVATNLPSWLKVSWDFPFKRRMNRLAELPDGCTPFPDPDISYSGGHLDLGEKLRADQRLFAVGGQVGEGRLLVLADHSLFINAMMMPTDNSNVEFAYNCLDYLRGPAGSNQRNRVLFLEEGKANSNFNVPLKQTPGLPPEALNALLAKIGDHLAELENPREELDGQNVFDHSIVSWWERHGVTSVHVRNAVLVVLTLALLAYGCRRMLRANGFRPEPGVPLAAEASAAVAPTAALLDQRLQALMQLGNLWESGRALARQVFASADVDGASRMANGERASRRVYPGSLPRPEGSGRLRSRLVTLLVPHSKQGRLPRIVVRGSWWQRWRRVRQVARLWRLAYASTPVRISPAAWPKLVEELEQLQADLAHGMVKVEMAV